MHAQTLGELLGELLLGHLKLFAQVTDLLGAQPGAKPPPCNRCEHTAHCCCRNACKVYNISTMQSTTITIRVPVAVKKRLDRIVAQTGRSRSAFGTHALGMLLDLEEWQLQALDEGIEEADAGALVAHSDVVRRVTARLKKKR